MNKTTKPSREEVLKIAKECGFWGAETNSFGVSDKLERFAAAMYAKGAEDMRERAIEQAKYAESLLATEYIRALPITQTNTEGEQA